MGLEVLKSPTRALVLKFMFMHSAFETMEFIFYT